MQPAIQQFILQLSETKSAIAQQVRDIFLATDDSITEAIKWNTLTFSVGRKNIAFIYSMTDKDYMNLGFHQATSLSDPKKLFEGTGKGMRHIKLHPDKKIPTAQIKAWIKEAVLLAAPPSVKVKTKTAAKSKPQAKAKTTA